jgi:hypothetical protein
MNDTVVDSVRRIRESIFKTCEYDLKKLCKHEQESYKRILQDKKTSGRTVGLACKASPGK